MNSFLVENSELTIITGTTLVNGTFDGIWKSIDNYQKKYMIFGVSAVEAEKL